MNKPNRNFSVDKSKNYLNRKTLRKNKRKELKQKKDSFFRNKNNLGNFNPKSKTEKKIRNFKFFNRDSFNNKTNQKKDFKKPKLEEKAKPLEIDDHDIDDIDEDEEINSEIASDNENNSEINSEENFDDNRSIEDENEFVRNNPLPDDDIENEIKALEKKLGLKDKIKYNKFKKKTAIENYDEDLFDFLDNINNLVGTEKISRNKSTEAKDKTTKSKILPNKEQLNEPAKNKFEEEKTSFPNSEKISEKPQSKLFANSKFSDEDLFKQKFNKEITSLFNKISEANLNLMFPDLLLKLNQFEVENAKSIKIPQHTKLLFLYETITKVSLRMNLDQEITNLPITSCICSYLSILHYKYGNSFMIYFLKSLFDRVEDFFALKEGEKIENLKNFSTPKSTFKNFIFTLIHFYIFGNLNSKIFFEIIKHFIENFNESYSEMLLILLSYIGIEIRKEDPESLKEIISNITKKYNLMKVNTNDESMTGKIKYIVDMIEDIKNNKYIRFNLSEKFNFFKNFVNVNKKNFVSEKAYDLKSSKIADKIEISWQSIKNLDKNKIADFIQTSSENDLEKSEYPNVNEILLENELNEFDEFNIDNSLLEKKLKKFKITTDLKKKIFISIVSSSDCNDAFERLNRLNLKRDQAREIIKLIVLLANEEKCYNPFYRMLLGKLISIEKDHKYTFHYTIWDYLKIMNKDTFTPKKLHNLSKLVSDMLNDEKISLPVLLPFEFDDANDYQKLFVTNLFDYYFKNVGNSDKCKLIFAKLVKNDDHVEFGKRLFTFFMKNFKTEVNLEEKSQQYLDCYSAALRVLKRIL